MKKAVKKKPGLIALIVLAGYVFSFGPAFMGSALFGGQTGVLVMSYVYWPLLFAIDIPIVGSLLSFWMRIWALFYGYIL